MYRYAHTYIYIYIYIYTHTYIGEAAGSRRSPRTSRSARTTPSCGASRTRASSATPSRLGGSEKGGVLLRGIGTLLFLILLFL